MVRKNASLEAGAPQPFRLGQSRPSTDAFTGAFNRFFRKMFLAPQDDRFKSKILQAFFYECRVTRCLNWPIYGTFDGLNEAMPLDHLPSPAGARSAAILVREDSLIGVHGLQAFPLGVALGAIRFGSKVNGTAPCFRCKVRAVSQQGVLLEDEALLRSAEGCDPAIWRHWCDLRT